jgi:di/tricarboxylate transporter
MAGQKIANGGWGEQLGLNVVGFSRGGSVRLAPSPNQEIIEGDIVFFTGYTDETEMDRYGLIFTRDPAWTGQFVSADIGLIEVVLSPRSSLAGKTLREIRFRDKHDLSVLAMWRAGNTIREGLADLPLHFGDALLLMGQRAKLALLRAESDFIVLEEDIARIETPGKAALAVGLTVTAIVLSALNILPIAEATFAAATLMILFNCLSMEDAYKSIEWKTIFLIAGMIPLGLAIGTTGTADFVGGLLVSSLGQFGALAVAGGIFLVSMLLTQVMSGQATALVLAPIAIATAQSIGVDPRGLAMAVAMGCSTAFLTPFGHPANMLVMGPGGYTVKDYAKVGLPLTIILFILLLITLPIFWNIY